MQHVEADSMGSGAGCLICNVSLRRYLFYRVVGRVGGVNAHRI